jgi:hydrophobe/amphiphile efflux-1 (HAE1) family protein
MNLISLSIRRPVFAWVLMSALIIFGAISLNRLGVSQLPDVDFPVLAISVIYEGAAPEVVESELIEPIERRLLGIEGVIQMRSSVRQGSGVVTLDFDISRNVDVALQEVQAALSQLRLPVGIDPPIISKTNPEDNPFMFIGVTADKPIREVLLWADSFLLDQFRFIKGIGEVGIGGFSERNIRIWPDLDKLKKLDLTVIDILNAIQTQHLESAAGQYIEDTNEIRVRWLGEASSPQEIENIKILRRGNETIHSQSQSLLVKDVARVEDGLSDIRRMVRMSQVEGLGIGVRKQRGFNEVELAESIKAKIEELQPLLPEGYGLKINVDFSRATKAVVETTYQKLSIAALVTILICILFLGSWQAALNILFSIPTSIVGTFTIIYFSGFTMNLFTLLALTLAISIVVDDAIMLLENIVRHHRMGKSGPQAAYDGAMEILPAATAATLAVVAVFLPVVFMGGIIGKFFFQFGVTMSAAVLLSLIEAVTVTPMRAALFMSKEHKINKFEAWLEDIFHKLNTLYSKSLSRVLRWPGTVVMVSLVLFGASMFLVKTVRQEFVPMQDQDLIVINGQTPTGSSLPFTSDKAKEVEKIFSQHPLINRFFVSMGAGGPAAEVNQLFMVVELVPREKRKQTHVQVMDELRQSLKDIKNLRISLRDASARGLTSGRQFPVSFNLRGPDLNILNEKAKEMIEYLTNEGLAQDLDTDFKLGLPELLIKPDRSAMAQRGIAINSVANTLGSTIAGARQGRFTADGKRYDIRIKIPDEKVTSPEAIGEILVRNNYGNTFPLKELVTFEKKNTYQSISRLNRQRSVGVFGNVKTGQSQAKVLQRVGSLAQEVLPDGYGYTLEGSSAGLNESFKSLTMALLMGIMVAYMILAVQFNSFIHPVSILMALPFSITGALLVLWGTGTSLNLFSFIGLIVLMGIAKKNSILIVEFTNQFREKNPDLNLKNALVKACPVRLRPIIMTSVATIAAAIPLIIGNSIGQETRSPMGLTIIGGTVVSTVLTLYVVPCIYFLLSRFESKEKVELKI